ncbi:MAG: hypothetical protein ABFS42_13010 [Candidatus Krumholzibacteriota bacterium]
MNNRPLAFPLVLLLALSVGGCSEERYGILDCSGPIDTLAIYPRMEFQQIAVVGDTTATSDHDPGMAGMESLYLGSDGGTGSDILVNFDFSDIFSEDFPETQFTVDNIRSVKLSLHRLNPYLARFESSSIPGDIFYLVKTLDQPFDASSYRMWPGNAASLEGPVINSDFSESNNSDEPLLRLYPEDLVDWVQNRDTVGMVIHAADGSDGGLVGFASRELTHFSEVPALAVGTILAPSLVVEFNDYTDFNRIMIIPPVHDSSTFHSIASLPPELAHAQTGLRSYPVLTYDLSELSNDTCVLDMTFRLAASELGALHEFHHMSLLQVYPDSSWSSSGLIGEEDLQGASRQLNSLRYDWSDPGDPVYFTSSTFIRYFYPLPDSMHLMFGYESVDRFKSSIYFAQSTIFGPSADPEYRPVLLLLTRKKVE